MAASIGDPMTMAQVDDVFREYAATAVAGDAARFVKLWTDDGVQMFPGGPALTGKQAIEASMAEYFETMSMIEFEIWNEEVESFGDWAFARGTYHWEGDPTDGGERVLWDGKYLTIFQRQSDGSWKIHRDCFNKNTP